MNVSLPINPKPQPKPETRIPNLKPATLNRNQEVIRDPPPSRSLALSLTHTHTHTGDCVDERDRGRGVRHRVHQTTLDPLSRPF